MGYSTSRQTLDQIRPMLSKLEKGHGDLFKTEPGVTAQTLSYKIREALYIASLYPEAYPQLAKAYLLFKIQVVGIDSVQAVLLTKTTGAIGHSAGNIPSQGLEIAGRPHKVMGKQTAGKIIEYILGVQQVQPSNAQFQWPEANLTGHDAVRMRSWCHNQNPPWLFIMADGRVIISRKTRDMTEDLEWSPEDGE